MAFRGVGKSWITSAFVVWFLLMDPQKKVLVVSASKDRADDFVTFTKLLIELMPECHHLRPQEGQRDSRIAFDVGPASPDHQPSVKAKGVTSQLSGGRADLIVPDDIEVPNNSFTQLMRDKLRESVKEFDAILKPGGRIAYLGTPQTEDSLYFALPEEGDKGYKKRIWPARIPDDASMHLYGDYLAPQIELAREELPAGSPTDPKRFDAEDLAERELSYGRSGFAMQFMLLPNLSDDERYPLKLRDLIAYDCDLNSAPERLIWTNSDAHRLKDAPCVGRSGDGVFGPMPYFDKDGNPARMLDYTGKLLTIDPSGRGKDETAWCVTYMLHSTVFLMAQGGFRDGYSEKTLQSLADIAKRYKVAYCLYEDNFGDGMFGELLKPYLMKTHPVTVEGIRNTGMKEARIIDTLEPVMNQHRLVVNRRLFEDDIKSVEGLPLELAPGYQLFYQMTRMTKERGALAHDDRIDNLATAVRYWQDQLGLDPEVAARDARLDAFNREIEEFVERAEEREGKFMMDNWLDDQRVLQ